MANTCLMLAVITLYYFPRLGYCFFLFVANFKQVLSFDYFCYFSRFHQHHYFHYYRFILFFTTNVVITSVVTISAFLFYQSTLFITSTWWWACSMSATKTLPGLFFIFCYLLWAYILCIVASLITFRFMNFDTDRLYIASLLNFDCNCHVDVVCIKLK